MRTCPGCDGKKVFRTMEWLCCGNFTNHPVPECCENAVRWPVDHPCQYCVGAGEVTEAEYLELVGP